MENNNSKNNRLMDEIKFLDKTIAVPSLLMLIGLIIWVVIDNENVASILGSITSYVARTFGWVYLTCGIIVLGFSVYICFSKYGNIKIGNPDDKPEFNNVQYFAILFAGALGVGLTLWGLAEPLYIMQNSLYGFEANSPEMVERGLSLAFLHWGWIPWSFFGLPGVIYGYYLFNKKRAPRYVMALRTVISEKNFDSIWVKLLEALLLMASVAALPIMIINGVYLLESGLNVRFGIPMGTTIRMMICLGLCVVFCWSAVSGLKKGIAKLSTFNIWLAFGIVVFVFLFTDPTFIINLSTSAIGDLTTNFFKMALWSDPVAGGGFPQAWTIVYWIWWLVAALITGLVFANIVRGRTIKQALLPIIAISPLMSFVWFGVFSGGALSSDLSGATNYVGLLNEFGKEGLAFQFIQDLPLGSIVSILYIVLIAVFCITTTDSFCLSYAQICTKREFYKDNTGKTVEPPVIIRVIFCVLMILLSYVMLLTDIDFAAMQAFGALTTMPIIIMIYVSMYCFMKDLNKDLIEKENTKNQKIV